MIYSIYGKYWDEFKGFFIVLMVCINCVMRENNYVCSGCGVAGFKHEYLLKRNVNNYCSRVCFHRSKVSRVEINCMWCGVLFSKKRSLFLYRNNHFCSRVCSSKFQDKRNDVICIVCGREFRKSNYKSKNKPRHCCSLDCVKVLNNNFKDWGSNRSRLEVDIEGHLGVIFSDFDIRFNKTDIGYELDIFIPDLKLAIEINGIHHYEDIFKNNRFFRTQQIDKEKIVRCNELDIKLFVINVSRDGQNKEIQVQRISEVEQIIRDRIIELDFKNEQMLLDI